MGDFPAAATGAPLRAFINYRHEDTQGTAWGVYWPLETRLGRENVFFDNGKLRAGQEWLGEINAAIDAADALLVLIGPSWQRIMSDRLRRDGTDYVAHEIARALQRGSDTSVIPLLVDSASPPDPSALPPSLKRLASCQVERVRHSDLREDIEQLIERLSEIAAERGLAIPDQIAAAKSPLVTPVRVVLPDPVAAPARMLRRPRAFENEEAAAIVAPAPDDGHYGDVAEEAMDNGVVAFLGSDVNAEDSTTLPDDRALAQFISSKVKLGDRAWDLAEVAQHARALKGEQRVFQLMREGLPTGAEPGHVHRYLAGLPSRLAELGYERRHQMIVTPKYDDALERAFRERNEPFDVVVYMGPGTELMAGKFVHVPWDGEPIPIDVPNEYRGLPIRSGSLELERSLIVRIHGSVDDPDLNFTWRDNFVVTEDHYIQYLTGSPATGLIPGQIIEKLRSTSYLFLGYTMADWRLRVFLKRLWPGERLGNGTHWAVERSPTRLEDMLCFASGVKLFQSSLIDYVDGFDRFVAAAAEAVT